MAKQLPPHAVFPFSLGEPEEVTGDSTYTYTGKTKDAPWQVGLLGRISKAFGAESGGINPMAQPINKVSDIPNDRDYNQTNIIKEQNDQLSPMAQKWGEYYQTEQDPIKMAKFQEEMNAPINETIQNLAQIGSGAFSESETGMSDEDFTNLLYHTGFHESGAIGGQPQMSQGQYKDNKWVTTGPAGSYFQVEPSTLKDLVTATQPQVGDKPAVTNPSKRYWGDKAAWLSGYTAEQLYEMSPEKLSTLLQDPKNQRLGAVAAAAKYAQSFNNPVNETMDVYNKREDIYNY